MSSSRRGETKHQNRAIAVVALQNEEDVAALTLSSNGSG
jgi:hypothetical protein